MDKKELKRQLLLAAKNKTLVTPKHDPNQLSTTYNYYRSVLSHDLYISLDAFIESEDYTVREYRNNNYPYSPLYLEIIPNPSSTFSVPASGVVAYSPMASSRLDTLIAVSGTKQGWHIFGEDSQVTQIQVKNGDLVFIEQT